MTPNLADRIAQDISISDAITTLIRRNVMTEVKRKDLQIGQQVWVQCRGRITQAAGGGVQLTFDADHPYTRYWIEPKGQQT